MIQLISTLIQKGFAYQGGSDIFFSVEKFNHYGKISKRNLEDMQAGARVDIDEKKENPLDFALWKGSKPGEPFWESPWGKGRPGWHIECSVMSQKYLGETFDIHGGGRDLTFPHHENEIAQSEAATSKTFVRYWIHNGFVNINKEKMSKSLGNILTIIEILKEWHPQVLRLFFLSHHYPSPVDYSEDNFLEAKPGLDRFYSTLNAIQEELKKPQSQKKLDSPVMEHCRQAIESFQTRFEEAMDDDFNTAQALGYFYDLQTYLNTLLSLSKGQPTEEIASLLKKGLDHLSTKGWVFGLFRDDPEKYLARQRTRGWQLAEQPELIRYRLVEEVADDGPFYVMRHDGEGSRAWDESPDPDEGQPFDAGALHGRPRGPDAPLYENHWPSAQQAWKRLVDRTVMNECTGQEADGRQFHVELGTISHGADLYCANTFDQRQLVVVAPAQAADLEGYYREIVAAP